MTLHDVLFTPMLVSPAVVMAAALLFALLLVAGAVALRLLRAGMRAIRPEARPLLPGAEAAVVAQRG